MSDVGRAQAHAERRVRLAGTLEGLGVEALLVTDLMNCRYLTGFSGSNAALLMGDKGDMATLVTDSRYETAVADLCPGLPVALHRDAAAGALREAAAAGLIRVGIEAEATSLATGDRLGGLAPELGVELVATPDQVGALRQIKDQYEIGLLREACEISQRALQRLMLEVRVGTSERMVAARLEFLMREEGADAAAFSTIVATGSSSAEPHHEPTDRVIERGDLLKIDFGARWQGYHADMTRTFVVGAPASAWQLEVHRLVAEAAGAGRAAVAPGVEAREVDAAARRVIDAAGYGQNFGHGIGHGIGLQIHEAPLMGAAAIARLQPSMTITVEPGVYLPGRGGVRIEDSLVVTPDGAQPMTTLSRDLLVLG